MPKFVMPSAAKNSKFSEEKKRKNLPVLTKTPRLKVFLPAKLLSSNVFFQLSFLSFFSSKAFKTFFWQSF